MNSKALAYERQLIASSEQVGACKRTVHVGGGASMQAGAYFVSLEVDK